MVAGQGGAGRGEGTSGSGTTEEVSPRKPRLRTYWRKLATQKTSASSCLSLKLGGPDEGRTSWGRQCQEDSLPSRHAHGVKSGAAALGLGATSGGFAQPPHRRLTLLLGNDPVLSQRKLRLGIRGLTLQPASGWADSVKFFLPPSSPGNSPGKGLSAAGSEGCLDAGSARLSILVSHQPTPMPPSTRALRELAKIRPLGCFLV